MSEYKVGDRIRYLVDDCDMSKGTEYTVTAVDLGDDYQRVRVIDDEGDSWWRIAGDYEAVVVLPDLNPLADDLARAEAVCELAFKAYGDLVATRKALRKVYLDAKAIRGEAALNA